QQIVKLQVAAGARYQEAGDLPQALLWYAEALRLAGKDKLPEEAHRLRLAIFLAQHPRPVQAWFPDEAPRAAGFTPDGKRIMTVGASDVQFWDPATGKQVGETIRAGALTFASLSPDGKYVVTADVDRDAGAIHARLWDAADGKQLIAMEHESPVSNVVFSPD